jgi:beta-galactosidase/beta-glucuronidase
MPLIVPALARVTQSKHLAIEPQMISKPHSPAYPRPRIRREKWVDLCGEWQFAYDDDDVGLPQRWHEQPERFDRKIIVPFPPESELSGINDKGYHAVVWYRREVEYEGGSEGHLLLHFGAVDYEAQVWVNGDLVARHEGGHTPFSADITPSLKSGGKQKLVIVVRAEDQPLDVTQPRGKQDWREKPHAIWYHRTTGIWQPVWLEPVPVSYIDTVQFVADPTRAMVSVEITLDRLPQQDLECKIELRGGGILLASYRVTVTAADLVAGIHIPAFEHGQHRSKLIWTPENPNLIDVSLQLVTPDGQVVDQVESYCGMRSCSVESGRFLLNDKPFFMRSVLEQGFWPQSHLAAPDPEAYRREVELIKSLGFNAVRIHQKVEDPRFLYWCDVIGLLVWGEMANAFQYSAKAVGRFTREWLEVLDRDRSHPCIVTWVPLNESWGVPDIALRKDQQAFATSLYHVTKSIDPTRPVISNDGWEHTISDILGVHDYALRGEHLVERYHTTHDVDRIRTGHGPQRRRMLLNPTDERGQPVMLTEFGGISYRPETGQRWFGYATVENEAEYLDLLEKLFDAIHTSPELGGYCYTQLTDTLQERNGLLDENRKPKLPVAVLREIIWRPSNAIPTEDLEIARNKAYLASGFAKDDD